jgi:hypothetical protein
MKRKGISRHIQNVCEALLLTPLPYYKMTKQDERVLDNLMIIWGMDSYIPRISELKTMQKIFSKYDVTMPEHAEKGIQEIMKYRRSTHLKTATACKTPLPGAVKVG